jgi:hypothetical protein
MTVGKTSAIVGKVWKQQPPSVLQFFEVLSMVGKQRHKAMYPNYKYTPRRRVVKKDNPFILVNYAPLPTTPVDLVPPNPNSITTCDGIDGIEMFMDESTEPLGTFVLYENFSFDEGSIWIDQILGNPDNFEMMECEWNICTSE